MSNTLIKHGDSTYEALVSQDDSEVNVIFIHSKLDEIGLSAVQFRIFAHLSRRAHSSGKAWPGIDSMAEVCRMNKDTVTQALRDLEDRAMITVERSTGRRSIYRLTAPSRWMPDTDRPNGGNGQNRPKGGDAPSETEGRHRPEIGNVRRSNEGYTEKDIQTPIAPKGAGRLRRDNTPTSEPAIWLCNLFSRRLTTVWKPKEIRAFRDVQAELDPETMAIVEAYYTAERAKGTGDKGGHHRHDLPTFLNNALGEIERARSWAKQHPKTAAAIAHKAANPQAAPVSNRDIMLTQSFSEWLAITYGKSPGEVRSHLHETLINEYRNDLSTRIKS